MSWEAAIDAYIKADEGIKAIVGKRIHDVVAPQGETVPYLAYLRISVSRSFLTKTARVRFQFSCVSDNREEARTLGEAVTTSMNGFIGVMNGSLKVMSGVHLNDLILLDDKTGLYHCPVDIMLIIKE